MKKFTMLFTSLVGLTSRQETPSIDLVPDNINSQILNRDGRETVPQADNLPKYIENRILDMAKETFLKTKNRYDHFRLDFNDEAECCSTATTNGGSSVLYLSTKYFSPAINLILSHGLVYGSDVRVKSSPYWEKCISINLPFDGKKVYASAVEYWKARGYKNSKINKLLHPYLYKINGSLVVGYES